jgi:hypothetical protein
MNIGVPITEYKSTKVYNLSLGLGLGSNQMDRGADRVRAPRWKSALKARCASIRLLTLLWMNKSPVA